MKRFPTVRVIIVALVVVASIYASNRAQKFSEDKNHQEEIKNEYEANEELEEAEIKIEWCAPANVPLVRTSQFVNLTYEEMDLLEAIAMAEARGEDSKGKALVMRVVLNRSLVKGKSIREIIYAPNQFYTAGMTKGDDDCHEALTMVMDGWDESQGALYFCAGGYSRYGEPLFQYGGHYFSK